MEMRNGERELYNRKKRIKGVSIEAMHRIAYRQNCKGEGNAILSLVPQAIARTDNKMPDSSGQNEQIEHEWRRKELTTMENSWTRLERMTA